MYWFRHCFALISAAISRQVWFPCFQTLAHCNTCEMTSILSCPQMIISAVLHCPPRSSDLSTCSQRLCRIYRTTIIQGIDRFSMHCTDHLNIRSYLLSSLLWGHCLLNYLEKIEYFLFDFCLVSQRRVFISLSWQEV